MRSLSVWWRRTHSSWLQRGGGEERQVGEGEGGAEGKNALPVIRYARSVSVAATNAQQLAARGRGGEGGGGEGGEGGERRWGGGEVREVRGGGGGEEGWGGTGARWYALSINALRQLPSSWLWGEGWGREGEVGKGNG